MILFFSNVRYDFCSSLLSNDNFHLEIKFIRNGKGSELEQIELYNAIQFLRSLFTLFTEIEIEIY